MILDLNINQVSFRSYLFEIWSFKCKDRNDFKLCRSRTKYAELQNHQRRLYENSAYVTASLPQSTTTDSPSMQRK